VNVSLTKELEEFIDRKVESGRYTSASEVVREALRLLEGQETTRAAQIELFNAELERRLAALDRGEHISAAESKRRIAARSRERRKLSA
jgi:antitoxin ParD1/3/4